MLRRYAEGIGDAVEEGKHRNDIDGLGNLVFRPSNIAKPLHILWSRTGRAKSNDLGIVQQSTF